MFILSIDILLENNRNELNRGKFNWVPILIGNTEFRTKCVKIQDALGTLGVGVCLVLPCLMRWRSKVQYMWKGSGKYLPTVYHIALTKASLKP